MTFSSVFCVTFVLDCRDVIGSCSMMETVETKKLSWAQYQAPDKSVTKVVTECVDNHCSCTSEGPIENKWETLHFSRSVRFVVNAAFLNLISLYFPYFLKQ